jgi:hypothetical protein
MVDRCVFVHGSLTLSLYVCLCIRLYASLVTLYASLCYCVRPGFRVLSLRVCDAMCVCMRVAVSLSTCVYSVVCIFRRAHILCVPFCLAPVSPCSVIISLPLPPSVWPSLAGSLSLCLSVSPSLSPSLSRVQVLVAGCGGEWHRQRGRPSE